MKKKMLFLLADDDADDQLLFLEALGEIDTSIECLVALNGEDALQKLKDRRENLPNYIFLDLNMPRMNGLQCLNEIKKMEQLHNIPVIIYTTSAAQRDIDESKKSGAEKFITKPTSFQELKNILHELVA
ncbi:MAG: response regulator [Chitinophagaceae bacterium]